MSKKLKIPKIIPRRPYIDEEPNGYFEGDTDWFLNNRHAAVWLMENRDVIKKQFDGMQAEIKRLKDLTSNIP